MKVPRNLLGLKLGGIQDLPGRSDVGRIFQPKVGKGNVEHGSQECLAEDSENTEKKS